MGTKELRFGSRLNLQLSVEVFNVFDEETYRIYNRFYEAGQRVNGSNEAEVLQGRRWQLSAKLAF